MNRLRRILLSTVVASTTLAATAMIAPPAQAANVTISGYVYRDLNNNGVQDVAEPGVAGIRAHSGSGAPTTTTAADGSYTLLIATGSKIRIETGWFRSQCNDMTCPAGPGADNDFEVANQFVQYVVPALDTSNVNVGLVPDWPGAALSIPLVGGVVPANSVDVAARLSTVTTSCSDGDYAICELNDTITLTGQIHNQGTSSLSGIIAQVYIPGGDCLTSLTFDSNSTAPGITAVTNTPSTFTCGTRVVELAFAGTLVPGGVIRVNISGLVSTGPGTPGCFVGAPVAPCSLGEPQGRAWTLRVKQIAQSGDPDSTVSACTNPQDCPTGMHDKRREPDEVDPAGHNVDASLGGTTDFDLKMIYKGHKAPATIHPGDTVSVRAWVQNIGSLLNQANANSTVTMHFPEGTIIVAVQPDHNLLRCVTDLTPPTSEKVTCTYRAPLSPEVAALAITVSIQIPATWTVGVNYRTIACANPVAGQTGELIAPGATCDLTVSPGSTATNNDDFKDFVIS